MKLQVEKCLFINKQVGIRRTLVKNNSNEVKILTLYTLKKIKGLILILLTIIIITSGFYIMKMWESHKSNSHFISEQPYNDWPKIPQWQEGEFLSGESLINYIGETKQKNSEEFFKTKVLVETRGIFDDYSDLSYKEKLIKDPKVKTGQREIKLSATYKVKSVEFYANGEFKSITFILTDTQLQ